MPSPADGTHQRSNINGPHDAFQRFGRRVRRRLLWIFVAYGVGASLTFYFREATFRLLFAPANGSLSPYGGLPIFTGPSEMMSVIIHLAMTGGLVVAFPIAVISVYQLVNPLLSRHRRRFVSLLFLPAVFACYLGGVAFAYFVMLPVGLTFLLHFGTGIAVPLISISEYMSLVTAMLFWLGVVFEIPLVMFLLTKLRLVQYERFRRMRRYVPGAAFILSAIITPTFDYVNLAMVAVPIILLFEVGLFLSWVAEGGLRRLTLWLRTIAYRILRWPLKMMRKLWAMVASIWRRLLTVLMVPPRMARRGWTWFVGLMQQVFGGHNG